jgi:hypothetical protein
VIVKLPGVDFVDDGPGKPIGILEGERSSLMPLPSLPNSLPSDRMEGEREIAQVGSALGREFSYELLAAVANQDETTLNAELAKLVQAEILYQKGRPASRCSTAHNSKPPGLITKRRWRATKIENARSSGPPIPATTPMQRGNV